MDAPRVIDKVPGTYADRSWRRVCGTGSFCGVAARGWVMVLFAVLLTAVAPTPRAEATPRLRMAGPGRVRAHGAARRPATLLARSWQWWRTRGADPCPNQPAGHMATGSADSDSGQPARVSNSHRTHARHR